MRSLAGAFAACTHKLGTYTIKTPVIPGPYHSDKNSEPNNITSLGVTGRNDDKEDQVSKARSDVRLIMFVYTLSAN